MIDPVQLLQQADEQFAESVKLDLLTQLLAGAKTNKLSQDQVKTIAQSILLCLPFTTKEDVLQKLRDLSKVFEELRPVYLKYGEAYYEQKEAETRAQMISFLRQGMIDDAFAIIEERRQHG